MVFSTSLILVPGITGWERTPPSVTDLEIAISDGNGQMRETDSHT